MHNNMNKFKARVDFVRSGVAETEREPKRVGTFCTQTRVSQLRVKQTALVIYNKCWLHNFWRIITNRVTMEIYYESIVLFIHT